MKTSFILSLMFCFLSGFSSLLVAKEPPGKIVDASLFDVALQAKINKSNSLIEKGNQLWSEAYALDFEIEMLKSEYRFTKAKKLVKKKDRLLVQASNNYKGGHNGHYKILKQALEASLSSKNGDQAREGLMDGASLFKKAKKVRLSAQNRATDEESVALYQDAVNLENEALTLMEKSLNINFIADNVTAVATPSYQEEAFVPAIQPTATPVAVPVVPPVVVPTPVVVPPVPVVVPPTPVITQPPVPVVTEPIVKVVDKAPSKVYFSIQILADRNKPTSGAVSNVYSGSLPIIHIYSDGWHRYMVGKFNNVAEAKQKMASEGIKGFIVAYNGDNRIPVQEAVELLKNAM